MKLGGRTDQLDQGQALSQVHPDSSATRVKMAGIMLVQHPTERLSRVRDQVNGEAGVDEDMAEVVLAQDQRRLLNK